MRPVVHLLATCRNPALWRGTTLIFDTIRTGFPTAAIYVTGNALSEEEYWELSKICEYQHVILQNQAQRQTHAQWIRTMIECEAQPFFICDTDVIFWESVERFEVHGPLHGRLVPRFRCPFTHARTHARLHTSLLYIEPEVLLMRWAELEAELNAPANPFWTGLDLVSPQYSVLHGEKYLHDSMSLAYHTAGGAPFGEELLNCYDHLNAGTYADLLDGQIQGFLERQQQQLKDPRVLRGLWRKQNAWFSANAA